MIRLAERRRNRTGLKIEFLDFPGERIPLADGSMDTVVSTFTLCSIPGIVEAIRGIGRVLRPGGKLIFFEHTLAPDPEVQRWQHRWEPIHYRIFGGLRLTLDTPSLIRSDFRIEQMEMAYLARFPKSWTHFCWGTATPLSRGRPR